MFRDVQQALLEPEAFFERTSPANDLGRAVAILLALGFVSVTLFPAIVALLRRFADVGMDVTDALPEAVYAADQAEVSVPGIFLVIAFGMVGFPLLAWIAYGLVFHALSWPVAADGTLRETMTAVAWGFLPQLVASLVTLVAVAAVFPGSDELYWGLGITLPARTYATTLALSPVLIAGNTVGALCTVWSGYVWSHAIATVRGTTTRQAAVIVGIPVAVSLLTTVPFTQLLYYLFW